MVVSLVKGQRISFAKENSGLRSLILNVHWKVKGNAISGARKLEIDMSAFLLDQIGKCRGDSDIVFYGNTNGRGGAVILSGKLQTDGLVGEGFKIDLSNMPIDVEKVVMTLSIYEAEQRQQVFSMIEGLSTSVLDGTNGTEICRFDINWNFTIETAIVMCEIYKKNGEWRFNPVGAGYQGGLAALCKSFGIDVNNEEGSATQQVIPSPPVPQARPVPPPLVNNMSTQRPPRLVNEPLASVNNNPVRKKFNFSPQHMATTTSLSANSVPPNLPRCRCSAELRPDSKFCIQCGTSVVQKSSPPISQGAPTVQCCISCGNVLRPGSKFCTGCGKPV